MKHHVLISGLCLGMLLTLSACGKKAKDHKHKPAPKGMEEIQTSPLQETHKDLQKAIIEGDLARAEEILIKKTPVDLNKLLEDGETLLTLAAKHNRFRIIQLLHENNCSVHRTNSKRETPLMVAARLGHENLVKLLISLDAKIDTKDNIGNTALHLAILNAQEEVALILINSNANIDITNDNNHNALKLAELMNLRKVSELLRSLTHSSVSEPDESSILNLITLGDVENLNPLLTKYPYLVHKHRSLNLLVLILQTHDHDKALSMMLLMLGYGAEVNGPKDARTTPLITAVRANYEDIVTILLEREANPNLLDANGKSALVWAIEGNNRAMVSLLLQNSGMQKYTYYENGSKKTIKSCEVASSVRRTLTTPEERKANEDIQALLSCRLRWFF